MGSANTYFWTELLERNIARKTYAPNETIHFQGEPLNFIGYVLSGKIEAVVFSENGDEVWIDEFSKGDFIGHMSFLKDARSKYELIAKSDVKLGLISAQKMRELIESAPSLREAFIADFSKRLDVMTESLVGAYALSAKGRICAELFRLSREIGIDPDKHIIRPNPVYVELARRVNSTRETVSRTVSDLQKMGILSREPGALIVQKPQKLATAFQ